MSILDGFRWLVGREVQTRDVTENESVEGLVNRLSFRSSPWRAHSPREAMGVPAVFKAISLISNTTGSLSMEAYRQGAKLDPIDTPRIVVRPNPFTRPHVFWRDSAFHLARRGEVWWWTAKRDADDSPMSLIPIDPREITVEENRQNLLRPIIKWRDVVMPNDDMTQITYLPDPANPYRGFGPLQACGAAISVAVEAQDYAANFFAGNPAHTWIKSALDIDEDEAAAIKARWMDDSTGLPKVTGPQIEDVRDISVDPTRSQLPEMRLFQNGEVALMFSMPPTLLNYAVQGSTITYQNVGQVADDMLRQCLLPHYLEPMEQAMSDLLTRATIGRFNTRALLRPDPKTRAEIWNLLIPLGVTTSEQAAAEEGFLPGDVENRPIPFAAPQAIPASLPIQPRELQVREVRQVHCTSCGRLIAETDGWISTRCRKCGTQVTSDAPEAVEPTFMTQTRDMPTVVISEGAIQVRIEAPPAPNVSVESPTTNVTFAEGSIHNPVTIEDGAVRVDSPVTIEQGAVTVEAQEAPAPRQLTNLRVVATENGTEIREEPA